MNETAKELTIPGPGLIPHDVPKALHALIAAAANDWGTEEPFYEALNVIRAYGDARAAAERQSRDELVKELAEALRGLLGEFNNWPCATEVLYLLCKMCAKVPHA